MQWRAYLDERRDARRFASLLRGNHESGKFELTNVPPGEYEIVAWYEGWGITRQEGTFDVLTERRVERPVFTPPRTWEKKVAVDANGNPTVNFLIADK